MLASVVGLVANICYDRSDEIEAFWLSNIGWSHLGLILSHTKLDVDNPTVREYALLLVRNLTAWSEPIKAKLAALSMMDGKPYDAASQATFENLGPQMQEMYLKEAEKRKKDEDDQAKLQEAMMKASNVDVVDF